MKINEINNENNKMKILMWKVIIMCNDNINNNNVYY